MPRKTSPTSTPNRRSYTVEFKRNAVAMLLDGHSAASIEIVQATNDGKSAHTGLQRELASCAT
jgi:transposase-like protein